MTRERAPAFQFYARDFLADAHVQAMTLEERGAYIWLLAHCWMEGRLSGDERTSARICGVPSAKYRRIWAVLEPRFTKHSDGTYSHKRLEVERKKQAEHSAKQAANGRKRWAAATLEERKALVEHAEDMLAVADERLENKLLDDEPPLSRGIDLAMPPLSQNDALHLHLHSASTPPFPLTPLETPLPPPERITWFDRLYRIYPNKDRKQLAEVAWFELGPSESLAARVVADVEERVRNGWAKYERRFIPLLKNYIAERQWLDGRSQAEPSPFDSHVRAWQCRTCGEIHEGKLAQVGQCLAVKAS